MMDARAAALRALGDLREGRRTARQAIDTLIEAYALPDRQIPLATELVHGVVRHRLTLSTILAHFTRHRWRHVSRRLQHIMMLGAYQVIWLDAVPVFAAVNEAVNQAKREGGQKAGRFVNGVLRQLERSIEQRRVPADQTEATRSIPIDRSFSCRLTESVLPDPATNAVGYLSRSTSHPAWLVARWMDAYGPERTRSICRTGMLRPPIFLRPNPLKDRSDELLELLAKEGLEPQPAVDGESILVENTSRLGRSALLREGWFQPQDPTAQLPVRNMELRPGQGVLDLCAGLGTKTTQIVEALGDDGVVLATDVDERRLTAQAEVVQRLGYRSVQVFAMSNLDRRVAALDRLDWVLIDAPCSNSGVFARRPEIRYRLSMRELANLADTQLALLERAGCLAGRRTRLMYSTCSIDPEENEQVCARFLQAHAEWTLGGNRLTLPDAGASSSGWHDGGYWAILTRR